MYGAPIPASTVPMAAHTLLPSIGFMVTRTRNSRGDNYTTNYVRVTSGYRERKGRLIFTCFSVFFLLPS